MSSWSSSSSAKPPSLLDTTDAGPRNSSSSNEIDEARLREIRQLALPPPPVPTAPPTQSPLEETARVTSSVPPPQVSVPPVVPLPATVVPSDAIVSGEEPPAALSTALQMDSSSSPSSSLQSSKDAETATAEHSSSQPSSSPHPPVPVPAPGLETAAKSKENTEQPAVYAGPPTVEGGDAQTAAPTQEDGSVLQGSLTIPLVGDPSSSSPVGVPPVALPSPPPSPQQTALPVVTASSPGNAVQAPPVTQAPPDVTGTDPQAAAPPPAETFEGTLQRLKQQYTTQVSIDFFIDPSDPKNHTTTLQAPHETRPLTPAAQPTIIDKPAKTLPPPPPPPQVTKVRRVKSHWERTGGVALFAQSSSDASGDDEFFGSFSDGEFSTGNLSHSDNEEEEKRARKRAEQQHNIVGERRTQPSPGGRPYDELDEECPATTAAQREAERKAQAKQRRKLAKDAAQRAIYTNAEARTDASFTSGSQQGVSGSCSSGTVPTPQKDRADARRRRHRHVDACQPLPVSGHRGTSQDDEGEDVYVDAEPPTTSDSISTAVVPYVPTLRGPVNVLQAIYGVSIGETVDSAVQTLFSWQPQTARVNLLKSNSLVAAAGPSLGSGSSGDLVASSRRPFATSSSGEPTPKVIGSTLSVTIRGMSPLHADVGVVHPFVRVWFVHCMTGENLLKSGEAVPCAITHPYDLRSHASRSPWWEAEVALPLNTDLVQRHRRTGVLLFEVLDCGNETIHGFFMPRVGLYPICWGFLMLHDCFGRPSALYSDNVHVQLFRYPLRTPWYLQWVQSMLPSFLSSVAVYAPSDNYLDPAGILLDRPVDALPNETNNDSLAMTGGGHPTTLVPQGATVAASLPVLNAPAVFLLFKNPASRQMPYQGGLVVNVRAPQESLYTPRLTHMLPFEEYLLKLLVEGGGSCVVPRRDGGDSDDEDGDGRAGSEPLDRTVFGRSGRLRAMMRSMSIINQQALGYEYARQEGERALLPEVSLQTTPIVGAVTSVCFLNHSPILIMGVTRHLQYLVELRNTLQPNLPVLAQLHGHTGHIHAVAAHHEDRFIVSCSADKTVRVWRVTDLSYTILAALDGGNNNPNSAQLVVEPICVLPHSHPVYSVIFHHDTIITAGYSAQLQVWRYDRLLSERERQLQSSPTEGDLPFFTPDPDGLSGEAMSSTRLTATFTPGLNATNRSAGGGTGHSIVSYNSTPRSSLQLGELICVTRADDNGIQLSLASNESSNRVWSVCSDGAVYCWRALYEKRRQGGDTSGGRVGSGFDSLVWQMSVRHRRDCAGASKVEVKGPYAIITCLRSPVVYVYDATTSEPIRVINTKMPPNTPITVLPDGEAFVAGAEDGTLAAWECSDGALCTPALGGYGRAKTRFPISTMEWAKSQQLAALISPAPCPDQFLPPPTSGHSVNPGAPVQMDGAFPWGSVANTVPTEVTLIAIVGTARSSGKPILLSDKHAAEDFCARSGGDVGTKQIAMRRAARTRALQRQRAEHESRKARLYSDKTKTSLPGRNAVSAEPDSPRSPPTFNTVSYGARTSILPETLFFTGAGGGGSDAMTVMSPDLDYSEKGVKINSILNFWRGLVRQHRHTEDPANMDTAVLNGTNAAGPDHQARGNRIPGGPPGDSGDSSTEDGEELTDYR